MADAQTNPIFCQVRWCSDYLSKKKSIQTEAAKQHQDLHDLQKSSQHGTEERLLRVLLTVFWSSHKHNKAGTLHTSGGWGFGAGSRWKDADGEDCTSVFGMNLLHSALRRKNKSCFVPVCGNHKPMGGLWSGISSPQQLPLFSLIWGESYLFVGPGRRKNAKSWCCCFCHTQHKINKDFHICFPKNLWLCYWDENKNHK